MPLTNLRYFSATEKAEATKQIEQFIAANFTLPEGENPQEAAKDAVEEASQEKVIDLFNQSAMIESLVMGAKQVIQGWIE